MTASKDSEAGHPAGTAGGESGGGGAMVPQTADGEQTLRQMLSELPEVPEFVPLVDSFREFVEGERKRQRQRVLGLTALFLVVLALFAVGPIYLGRAFLNRAEVTFRAQESSLQNLTTSIDRSVGTLAAASDELRKALELQQQLIAAVSRKEARPVEAPPIPAVAVAQDAPAAERAPSVEPAATTPAATSAVPGVASATALVLDPAPAMVPVVPPPVAAGDGGTNVTELLKQIEARIQAIRAGNEALLRRLEEEPAP